MLPIPHEMAISGIYLPPMLVAAMLGAILTVVSAQTLNRYGLSRYFFYPPLVSLAMMMIYTTLIGTFVFGA